MEPTDTHNLKTSKDRVPERTPSGKSKWKKKRGRRHKISGTSVLSKLNQDQIKEFKEAFNILDQDKDGVLNEEDLKTVYRSLGQEMAGEDIQQMLSEVPGPVNFIMFLTLFAERMMSTDPRDVIENAFFCFDGRNSGTLPVDTMKHYMTTMGDRMTEEDVDLFFKHVPVTNGQFNYRQLSWTLKHGVQDEEESVTEQALD